MARRPHDPPKRIALRTNLGKALAITWGLWVGTSGSLGQEPNVPGNHGIEIWEGLQKVKPRLPSVPQMQPEPVPWPSPSPAPSPAPELPLPPPLPPEYSQPPTELVPVIPVTATAPVHPPGTSFEELVTLAVTAKALVEILPSLHNPVPSFREVTPEPKPVPGSSPEQVLASTATDPTAERGTFWVEFSHPHMLWIAAFVVSVPLLVLLALLLLLRRLRLSNPVLRVELMGQAFPFSSIPVPPEPSKELTTAIPGGADPKELVGLLPPDDYQPQTFDLGPNFEEKRQLEEEMLRQQELAILQHIYEQNVRLHEEMKSVGDLALAIRVDDDAPSLDQGDREYPG